MGVVVVYVLGFVAGCLLCRLFFPREKPFPKGLTYHDGRYWLDTCHTYTSFSADDGIMILSDGTKLTNKEFADYVRKFKAGEQPKTCDAPYSFHVDSNDSVIKGCKFVLTGG